MKLFKQPATKQKKIMKCNGMVKSKDQIDQNIIKKKFDLVDARSKDRFTGITPDPRKNVRSGSIPNSICLPFKYRLKPLSTTILLLKVNLKFPLILKIYL